MEKLLSTVVPQVGRPFTNAILRLSSVHDAWLTYAEWEKVDADHGDSGKVDVIETKDFSDNAILGIVHLPQMDFGTLVVEDDFWMILRSEKYGGHVFQGNMNDKRNRTYVGTCEDVYTGLWDHMRTESMYRERIRNRVLKYCGDQYSEYQRSVSQDFLTVSEIRSKDYTEMKIALFELCNRLGIGLPIGGYAPKDLTPDHLRMKPI